MADYAETLKGDDEVLFHYAGHGLEIDGATMLLGIDFNARDKPDARRSGYYLDSLIDRLSAAFISMQLIGVLVAIKLCHILFSDEHSEKEQPK